MKSRQRSKVIETAWSILDDPESGTAARLYGLAMSFFIWFSFCTSLCVAAEWYPHFFWESVAETIEYMIDAVFAIEIIARFFLCPSRRMFFTNPFNIVDLVAGVPLLLRVCMFLLLDFDTEEGEVIRRVVFSAVPVLRMLKVLRRFSQIHLIWKALYMAFEALPVIIFMYLVLVFFFSAIVYMTEPKSNIEDFSTAVWLCLMSMTTVGYGDYTPSSHFHNRVIMSVTVWVSSLYMSIPLGIIGNAFNDVWKDREKLLLMQRTKDRLKQAGYEPRDIPKLFGLFDMDGNGQLDIAEFRWMLTA